MRRARAIKSRDAQCPCLNAMRRLRIGRRDFAQMRVRILLNAMGEARSWVLRAQKRSWRPICRAPGVRKSFKARERSVNVSHSLRGLRSDRDGILMEDFTFKVNLVAVVRVRAGDESVARKIVPTVLGAPGIAEIRLANENNAATGRHATVTDVDFSIGSVVPARNRRPRTTR
jgi:hypothetical protein